LENNAVLLGIQQLERQQAAMDQQQQQQQQLERQQQAAIQQQRQQQQQRHYAPPTHNNEDDDDHTEPSSTVSRNTGENPAGYTRTDTDAATSTFGKIIQKTRVSD
jgi:sRNA-binding protein